MAIKSVKATLNGVEYTLTLDSSTGTYKATMTAPGTTSFHQTGGYYGVSVKAENTAGTVTNADATTMEGLRLVVKEKVAPVISIQSPANGAYVSNSAAPVVFTVTDEAGGSGVKLSSLVVKLDGTAVAADTITNEAITNGYRFTYTPASALSDGSHTVSIECQDNDGNSAEAKSTTFTVDTVPPVLNVTAPEDGYITNKSSLNIVGTTNDITSNPVTLNISLNGVDQGNIPVANDGSFSKVVTLLEGENSIVVTATDSAGKSSSVTRTVTLDTTVPTITNATITPNPADAGSTVIVEVTITETV